MNAMVRGGSIYTNTARFDEGQRFLSEDEIRQVAPSVFATTAHYSRSSRFHPIATIEAIRALEKEGFGVVGATQSVSRNEDRKPFAKHMLRLRRRDDVKRNVGDTVFEALLKNANDGSSVWDILSGLFRIRCLNSMVAMATQMETAKVRHTGHDTVNKVIDATYRVISDADRALEAPDKWSRITLKQEEQKIFAEQAHALRFPPDSDGSPNTTLVKPTQLLIARRPGDTDDSLWTVFNRVQENAIRGGIEGQGTNARGRYVRRTSRQVKGIDQMTNLNRALWTLGEKMAELKQAA